MALFAPDADVMVLGSEVADVAVGREQVNAFFQRLFGQPVLISWEWDKPRVASRGDVAWVYAEGAVIIRNNGVREELPYRMTGVLQRVAGDWRWRQFHGTEPLRR